MRKTLVVVVALLVAFSLAMPAFASDLVKVKGTVIKIDTAAKSLTIKQKDGAEVTVVVEDAELLEKVKEGEKGEARYAVKDGKNVAEKVRRLTAGCD
ncbi:MAG: hypothetical protein A2X57_05085 [Nitrospirae bacterium GWD2_57_8]|jgi:Cu/Ag efflux protein CusF|nr:MAG: hypothetical protein A2X57_05085 [Nitrospirae bacterium GWD2_57_8]